MKKQFFLLVLIIGACSEKQRYEENPFKVSSENEMHQSILDSTSIQGLHQNIFSTKCANPFCHDGSFEPDFRTAMSTYNSLVFHQVTKNTPDEDFKYRVMPGDADSSWLYYRLRADSIIGRMPLYADPLSDQELKQISDWIKSGAPDVNGDLPSVPNLAPVINGYTVRDTASNRLDQNRVDGWASAMLLPKNESCDWTFYVQDDRSKGDDLKVQLLEFSYQFDPWQTVHSLQFVKLWNTVFIQNMNSQDLPQDTLLYFRYTVEDADGARTTEPDQRSPYWLINHYTLRVE